MRPANVTDYRELARRRLPRFLFDYIDGGSFGETTLRGNRAALDAIALRQRVLCDVGAIDLTCDIAGTASALPLVLAPVGLAGMNARRGEVQAARAAATGGVPFCLSTVSACALSEVRAGSPVPFWFQLYMIRDRAFMRDLLAQARAAGCGALVFTLDMPVPGIRYRDKHSGLSGPFWSTAARRVAQAAGRPRWAWDVGIRGCPHQLGNVAPVLGRKSGLEDFMRWMGENFDPTVTWADLAWVRSEWPGPLILKGVLDPDDARRAADHGADAIVVSNHGGRQLDGVLPTALALPPIVDAVGERIDVLADGGVQSGLDIVRMLALGAKGVLIGRAWAFALGAGGQRGVEHLLDILATEMRVAMALTGCSRVSEIGPHLLADMKGTK
jgi:L-lactate dehydrogenase (cytochrome)